MAGNDRPPALRILLDQNVPRAVAAWLREFRPDFEVVHTSDVDLDGRSDLDVFQWAQDRESVIITFDEDFTDRRGVAAGVHQGIIRLRVWPTTIEEITSALQRLLESVEAREIRGSLIIVGQHNIRLRTPRRPS